MHKTEKEKNVCTCVKFANKKESIRRVERVKRRTERERETETERRERDGSSKNLIEF